MVCEPTTKLFIVWFKPHIPFTQNILSNMSSQAVNKTQNIIDLINSIEVTHNSSSSGSP